MPHGIWEVLCTDPDKYTVVIKYIILHPDLSCEFVLAVNNTKTATSFTHGVGIQGLIVHKTNVCVCFFFFSYRNKH